MILKIATNTALDMLRSRRLTCSLEAAKADDTGESTCLRDLLPDTVDRFALADEWESLNMALNRLPARYRQALLMVGAGYSHTEIAAWFAITPDACKTMLNRARQALKAAPYKPRSESAA